jgi:hypothetical protein
VEQRVGGETGGDAESQNDDETDEQPQLLIGRVVVAAVSKHEVLVVAECDRIIAHG